MRPYRAAAVLPFVVLALACCRAPAPEAPVVFVAPAAPPPQEAVVAPAVPELQVAVAPVERLPFKVGQIWKGTYVCAQGETDLRLHVVAVAGNEVRAVFDFEHVPSRAAGDYVLDGRYDAGGRKLVLTPAWWIRQPPDYIMVGMSGELSADGRRWHGVITHPSCGRFSVALGR